MHASKSPQLNNEYQFVSLKFINQGGMYFTISNAHPTAEAAQRVQKIPLRRGAVRAKSTPSTDQV